MGARVRAASTFAIVLVASVSGCKKRSPPPPLPPAQVAKVTTVPPPPSTTATAAALAIYDAGVGDAGGKAKIDAGAFVPSLVDGGAAACTLVAPIEEVPDIPTPLVLGYRYSLDRDGAIRRAKPGEPPKDLGWGRYGTRIATGVLDGSHGVVAYLASRKTSEGVVLQAFAVLDEQEPVRISEDGSGATYVTLAPRGLDLIAAYVDARAALTPLHARPLRVKDGKLDVGTDAVVFVGGAADSSPRVALVTPTKGPALALLPMPEGARRFGMALVRLHEPPRDDEPVEWQYYPDGLTPAPVAAATVEGRAYFARVLPEEPGLGAAHLLELARVHDGVVTLLGVYAKAPRISDVELTAEGAALRVHYRSKPSSFAFSVRCP